MLLNSAAASVFQNRLIMRHFCINLSSKQWAYLPAWFPSARSWRHCRGGWDPEVEQTFGCDVHLLFLKKIQKHYTVNWLATQWSNLIPSDWVALQVRWARSQGQRASDRVVYTWALVTKPLCVKNFESGAVENTPTILCHSYSWELAANLQNESHEMPRDTRK